MLTPKNAKPGWPIEGSPDPSFVSDLIDAAVVAAGILSELDAAAEAAPGLIVRTDFDLASRNCDALDTLRDILARVDR